MAKLSRRGTFSLAVNNKAGHTKYRPQAFVFSDPPMKFSHSIWLDPAIMKFCPTPKLTGRRNKLRRKDGDTFSRMNTRTIDCPNVWGFQRDSWMTPDDGFFTSEGACWGNLNAGVLKTGQQKTVCTMLLGLRILYHLGARSIFLVGCDFFMSSGGGYSFAQNRTAGAVQSNNSQYGVINDLLCMMAGQGTFERFGLRVYNCCERSGLRAFPYVPIDAAIRSATDGIEEEPDLRLWYEKTTCPKCGAWKVRSTLKLCTCLKCKLTWHPDDPPKFDKEKAKK